MINFKEICFLNRDDYTWIVVFTFFVMIMIRTILIWCWIFALALGNVFAVSSVSPSTDSILTTDDSAIITPPEENAIREGTHDIIKSKDSSQSVESLLETQTKIENQQDATQRTLNLVHKIINYALSLVSVIAFIVLIFAGFQMVTAGGDDGKFKSGSKALKKIVIAIVGIAVSWMIVSFIFWFLETVI